MQSEKTIESWAKENKIFIAFFVAVLCFVFWKPFNYMIYEWKERLYSSYTPGPFVPVVSGYIIWLKRHELKKMILAPTNLGYVVIVFFLILHLISQMGDLQRISILAFIGMLCGFSLLFWGKNITKMLLFPICFLVFMVPLEFLDTLVGVRLRIIASQWAAIILELIGFQILRIGTQIDMIGIFSFDVAAPCSGLKSLVSLTALGIAFAYLSQKVFWKRLVLIVSAIPIAILANVFRVVMIGLIATSFGKETAMGFFHSFSGFFLFTFALLALTGIGRLLSWDPKSLLSS